MREQKCLPQCVAVVGKKLRLYCTTVQPGPAVTPSPPGSNCSPRHGFLCFSLFSGEEGTQAQGPPPTSVLLKVSPGNSTAVLHKGLSPKSSQVKPSGIRGQRKRELPLRMPGKPRRGREMPVSTLETHWAKHGYRNRAEAGPHPPWPHLQH